MPEGAGTRPWLHMRGVRARAIHVRLVAHEHRRTCAGTLLARFLVMRTLANGELGNAAAL